MLVAIAPGPEGLELRTFECRKCDHSFTNAVAKDPMNTVSAGWITGELEGADVAQGFRLALQARYCRAARISSLGLTSCERL